VIVLETSALIELLTDERGLRERVAARLLSEEAVGDRSRLVGKYSNVPNGCSPVDAASVMRSSP
jgi:hypothetical protein